MLTRLRVSGFKNLVDVDIRLGPFTCIAGKNGVGKSNLFDAIHFLSLLAERPLIDAVHEVRGGHTAGAASLFQQVGAAGRDTMTLKAEMIVPQEARDDLGQAARATITFLQYGLMLRLRGRCETSSPGPLEVVKEELRHIPRFEAARHLAFKHSAGRWRDSVIQGERRAPHFISTTDDKEGRFIHLHRDGGSLGSPIKYRAEHLPRTVLSGCEAAQSPTALIARQEIKSWRRLQLEPAALRRPDSVTSPPALGDDGSHLAALLHRLSRSGSPERISSALVERMSGLVDEVRGIRIENDEHRGLVSLWIEGREGAIYPAASVSDGSLRFLALSALELDPVSCGLIAVEEPENGIQPERIPDMLRLLHDIAVDVSRPAGADNPPRQVLVNTHSPTVAAHVPEESLLLARTYLGEEEPLGSFRGVRFHPLPKTWRSQQPESPRPVSKEELLDMLNPSGLERLRKPPERSPRRRWLDRDDIRQLLIPFQDGALQDSALQDSTLQDSALRALQDRAPTDD